MRDEELGMVLVGGRWSWTERSDNRQDFRSCWGQTTDGTQPRSTFMKCLFYND